MSDVGQLGTPKSRISDRRRRRLAMSMSPATTSPPASAEEEIMPEDGHTRTLLSRHVAGRPIRIPAAARGRAMVAIGVVALFVGLAGVAGASGTHATQRVGEQLTIGRFGAPTSLDPAVNNAGLNVYTTLAYDPLIMQDANGKLRPGLAVSWRYVGSGNRVFELTLRKGVRFSDGTRMTARNVKASLLRFRDAKGPSANLATYTSIDVTGPLTLRLRLSKPNPIIPELLHQWNMMGENVISPAALRDPSKLKTATFGAGPYMLNSSQTVPGDHYTFTPNPYYWNKGAVHYRRVVIKVISDPNSTLQALITGQIDVTEGDPGTVGAARDAELRVMGVPFTFVGIALADRGGSVSKPLGDVRVRQALNYAIDRKVITRALYQPGVATPAVQPSRPGLDNWVKSYANRYPYDPAKAKQLLAAAGYGEGFSLTVLSTPIVGLDNLVQAVSSFWDKIGVKVQLHSDAVVGQYVTDLASKNFPAFAIVNGTAQTFIQANVNLFPNAQFNPFHTVDAKIQSLYNQAAAAPAERATELYQQLAKRVVDQAWFAPVSLTNLIYYVRPNVGGARVTSQRPGIELRDLFPRG
jgi:peptide/nickel transport system substrate-binding protein